MIVLEKSAEAYSLRDANFELSFRHVRDRWQHCLSVRNHDVWSPLLTSVEGSPTDGVPPSPPLQDLRFEQLADEVFEFQLLGQSGKGVYSAAVRYDGGAGSVDFDLCVRGRSREMPLCTTSRYCLPGDGLLPQVRQMSAAVNLLARGGQSVEVMPVPISGSPPSECRLTVMNDLRQMDAGCFNGMGWEVAGKACSVRWRYGMAWTRIF